ncbi:hypothetical protein ACFE04_005472 [Oxalis oulophora]
MKEPESPLRRAGITKCFKQIPLTINGHEHVLVLSTLWKIAMAHPDDPEFPSLGLFDCVTSLIKKSLRDTNWLLTDQNIYIPYYAAHIIGSYTMNKVEFAQKAIQSGVIPPLIELLRGKISWVEQRVAVRALGHLASYEGTFEAVAVYEKEVVNLSIKLASTCVLSDVYNNFVGLRDKGKRLKYHCDLLTRGIGGMDMENKKAEEWASQIQCWSIYLLNCFASKERSLSLICQRSFLIDLSQMWDIQLSPSGVGLIRILCYNKIGRKSIAEAKKVVESLCNLSRSSNDLQYMGIDCLLLLLKDRDTRYKVLDIATHVLLDLVELKTLGDRPNLGHKISTTLLLEYEQRKLKIKNIQVLKSLEELWILKLQRKRESLFVSDERLEELRIFVQLIKQQGDRLYRLGNVEEAINCYNEALKVCPLKLKKERMMIYSNRGQCNLIIRETDLAIRDCTRALCLSTPANSHSKSLWRRSQAYDMKGLAKESLMDCIMFINISCVRSESSTTKSGVLFRASRPSVKKIPYDAARMISKQMEATSLFSSARSITTQESVGSDYKETDEYKEMVRMIMERQGYVSGLSTIVEEPLIWNKKRVTRNYSGQAALSHH